VREGREGGMAKVQSFSCREREQMGEGEAGRQVDEFRKEIIESVIEEKGRNFQYEGLSIHYFVGDLIKRNYNLLIESVMRRRRVFQGVRTEEVQKGEEEENVNLEVLESFY
jgi:hypothetical protein